MISQLYSIRDHPHLSSTVNLPGVILSPASPDRIFWGDPLVTHRVARSSVIFHLQDVRGPIRELYVVFRLR